MTNDRNSRIAEYSKVKIVKYIMYGACMLFFMSCKDKEKGRFKTSVDQIEIGTHKVKNKKVGFFLLKNIGNKKINIDNIISDCICIKILYDKIEIMPDSVLRIKVYNNDTFPGIYQGIVTVNSDAINSPNILIIRGKKVL